jgi:invasion protein IalB
MFISEMRQDDYTVRQVYYQTCFTQKNITFQITNRDVFNKLKEDLENELEKTNNTY